MKRVILIENNVRKVVMMLLLVVNNVVGVYASELKANADAAYRVADYQKAIELYKQELHNGESAAVFHNLGNCYYRIGNLSQAVLCYERALKYSPMDKDIQHSLEVTQRKTIDRLPSDGDILFTRWYKGLLSVMSIDAWTYTAIASLVLSLILFLLYLFADNILVRRLAFYMSLTFFVLFAFGNLFAWQRKNILTTHDTAVVVGETLMVKSSPADNASDACIIHEGTTLTITDRDIKGWYAIRLSDGRQGWIKTKEVEEI